MSHTFASLCVFPFIFLFFPLGVKWTRSTAHVIYTYCEVLRCPERNITYIDKQIPTDNDTVCKIIRNPHMKCCVILLGFCNPFLYIPLSASIC
jgi:hypothetical protein